MGKDIVADIDNVLTTSALLRDTVSGSPWPGRIPGVDEMLDTLFPVTLSDEDYVAHIVEEIGCDCEDLCACDILPDPSLPIMFRTWEIMCRCSAEYWEECSDVSGMWYQASAPSCQTPKLHLPIFGVYGDIPFAYLTGLVDFMSTAELRDISGSAGVNEEELDHGRQELAYLAARIESGREM
jgi:hypothetical protein